MEARVAKLEAHMDTVRDDCKEIKSDVKLLVSTTNNIAQSVSAVKASISGAKVWAMILYIGLAGALLFVMAKGFGWLK